MYVDDFGEMKITTRTLRVYSVSHEYCCIGVGNISELTHSKPAGFTERDLLDPEKFKLFCHFSCCKFIETLLLLIHNE